MMEGGICFYGEDSEFACGRVKSEKAIRTLISCVTLDNII